MAKNPSAFDAKEPVVAASLSQGIVPRGIDGFPKGPLVYKYVPLVGTKHLIPFINPKTKHLDMYGVPILGPLATTNRPANPTMTILAFKGATGR